MYFRQVSVSFYGLLLFFLNSLLSGSGFCFDEKPEIRFAAIGDFGTSDKNEAAVAGLVQSWNPDFIITLGDNNYPNGELKTIDQNIGKYFHNYIQNYHGAFGKGSLSNRFFPSLGNHDWNCESCITSPKPYLDYFSLQNSQRYYDFVKGPVHFFALDSDSREPDGNQASSIQGQWLKGKLKASQSPFRFVYFHHTPYSSGNHGETQNMQWPFKEWGASAVFAGHEHIYERYDIQGVPYFVNGMGGRTITPLGKCKGACKMQYNKDFGAMLVSASRSIARFEFYTKGNVKIDQLLLAAPR